MLTRFAQLAAAPRARLIQAALKRLPGVPFETLLQFDALERPHYAYATYHAARLAKRLGHQRITVIEMGVAGGNGLLCLERHANTIGQALGIGIATMGFDSGKGMPKPQDYRDCPQVWREGFYKMDQEALRARSARSKVFLGGVGAMIKTAAADGHFSAPIGAVMFDMDYYSSTTESFALFDLPEETRLPRVMLYADDIVHNDPIAGINDYVGQMQAIADYNEDNSGKAILPDRSLLVPRKLPARWTQQIFIHHDFRHPSYGNFVGTEDDQRRLK